MGLFPELEELAAQAAQLHAAGRYAEALGPARQLLRLTEQRAGPDHPLVSQSLNNLALVLQKAGQPGEAHPLLVRALQIDEHPSGAHPPGHCPQPDQSGARAPGFGTLCRGAAAPGPRSGYYPRSARVRASGAGRQPGESGPTRRGAGPLRPSTEPNSNRRPQIQERALGSGHPALALSLVKQAQVLRRLGAQARARPLLERALTIQRKTHGAQHPRVAATLTALGLVLKETGEFGPGSGSPSAMPCASARPPSALDTRTWPRA